MEQAKAFLKIFQWMIVVIVLELGVIVFQAYKSYDVAGETYSTQEMVDSTSGTQTMEVK